ncbi:MAG: hypothetical protein ACRDQA_02480 [Nocardioidaceae bacterium]
MSIETVTMYHVVCDWPGCGTATDDNDPEGYFWVSMDAALGDAHEIDWWFDGDRRHYCPRHPATWASDHENGEPYPAGAYLLIHDGDTGNPDDDGNVTLIQPGDGGLEEVALALERQRDDETVHHEACSLTEAVAIIREWARS